MRIDSKAIRNSLRAHPLLRAGASRDPRTWAPTLLIVLAAANLIAGWFVWQTPGGSAGDLEEQISTSQAQVQRAAADLTRLRALVKKVETARRDQNAFVARYFIDRRTASSTIVTELNTAASRAGLSPREHQFGFEPIEGSKEFSMMTIAANYEGKYSDLRQFIGALDKSDRFLIIEDITAAPQQEAGKLAARFKMNAFVRESREGMAVMGAVTAEPEKSGAPAATSVPTVSPTAASTPTGTPAAGTNVSLKMAERR